MENISDLPDQEPWAIDAYIAGYTGYATRRGKDGDLEEVECGHRHGLEKEARECVRDKVDPGWRAA